MKKLVIWIIMVSVLSGCSALCTNMGTGGLVVTGIQAGICVSGLLVDAAIRSAKSEPESNTVAQEEKEETPDTTTKSTEVQKNEIPPETGHVNCESADGKQP